MASQTITHTIDRRLLGAAGVDGYLHIVDDRRDDTRSAEERLADRTRREFRVRAALAKTRTPGERIRASIESGEGDCFVTAPDDLRIQTRDGVYEISRNGQGELALVSYSLNATWYGEAFEIFLSGVTPWPDHLSYLSDTPIFIDMLECRDDANHITTTSYRGPHGAVTLAQGLGQLAAPLFPIYALYREALNADSNFYKFLCLHKIFEGIFGEIRPKLFQPSREQGISLTTRQEVVPEHPELRLSQPQYIGRKIREIYDREFQDQYRHSVAHFALSDGSIMNPSSHRESARFGAVIYLARICARQVITNQEAYFAEVFRSGGRM
jgi:hypothetical protein